MGKKKAYGACPIKRSRRTRAQIAEDHDALLGIVEQAKPATVRHAFYLASVAGRVPKTEAGYDKVGRDLLALRRSKRMPYSWITDGTRWMRKPKTYDSVEDALTDAANTYRQKLWRDMGVYVEVWSEKDTVAGMLWEVTSPYDVPLMVSRGFTSDTFLYETAANITERDLPTFIYYVGDHDPSGVIIDRKIEEKLRGFAPEADITFERLAVRREQVSELSLPTRPTKREDNAHAKQFPDDFSVELEAIPPARLRLIVREAIEQHIDPEKLRVLRVAEKSERDIMRQLAAYLDDAREALGLDEDD
jgi:hypothetical protein